MSRIVKLKNAQYHPGESRPEFLADTEVELIDDITDERHMQTLNDIRKVITGFMPTSKMRMVVFPGRSFATLVLARDLELY